MENRDWSTQYRGSLLIHVSKYASRTEIEKDLYFLREQRCYVEDLGFEEERKAVWQQWRGAPPAASLTLL
jgi:hypothetical protein